MGLSAKTKRREISKTQNIDWKKEKNERKGEENKTKII